MNSAVLPLLCFGLLFTSIDDINTTGNDNSGQVIARDKGLAQEPTGNHNAGNGHKGAKDSYLANRVIAEKLIIDAKAKG